MIKLTCDDDKCDDDMFKGRAVYDQALKDLQGLADKDWERLVKVLLVQYVTMVSHAPSTARPCCSTSLRLQCLCR